MMIHTESLTKQFKGAGGKQVLAVDRLNLDVAEGEVFGFLGPNGAGKTTTMRMLTCLVGPTSGQAWVNGCQVGQDDTDIRRSVGILTESPGLYDRLSAQKNLTIFARLCEVQDVPGQVREVPADAGAVGPARRPGRRLLQGHAPEAGHLPGADPRAQGALPGRADLRPRPRGRQAGARLHRRTEG